MGKYHISKKGKVAECKATERPCPLGSDNEHFNSMEKAQKYADEKNKNENSVLTNNVNSDNNNLNEYGLSNQEFCREVSYITAKTSSNVLLRASLRDCVKILKNHFNDKSPMLNNDEYGLSDQEFCREVTYIKKPQNVSLRDCVKILKNHFEK